MAAVLCNRGLSGVLHPLAWDLLLLAWSFLGHAGQHVGGSDAIKVRQEAVGNSLTLGVDACSHGSCFLRKGALVPGLEVFLN